MSKLGINKGWGTLILPGSIDFDHPDDFYFGLLGDSCWLLYSSISSFSKGFMGVIDYNFSSDDCFIIWTLRTSDFSFEGGSGVYEGMIEESSPSSN